METRGALGVTFFVKRFRQWLLREDQWFDGTLVPFSEMGTEEVKKLLENGALGHAAVIVAAYTGKEDDAELETPYIVVRDPTVAYSGNQVCSRSLLTPQCASR